MTGRVVATIAMTALVGSAAADVRPRKTLEIYWIDVEGGAATLIVTPAGESVLIDAGNPGGRDARRIHLAATRTAGLDRIDHLIVTHFHRDHFGGVAEIARLMPIGTLHERDLATAPESERGQPELEAYRAAATQRRSIVKAGERLLLRQAPGAPFLSIMVLGADGAFAAAMGGDNARLCGTGTLKDPDLTDNRNSIVALLTFGPFRFFDGGDLTWNAEADLVCPLNRVGGPVDVFQTDHHGLDNSNNPVLLRTLAPAVAVVNNGPRKGNEPGSFAALQAVSSHPAVYQMHRNVGAPASNTARERIANEEGEDCAAHFIRLSVEPTGGTYSMWVPATGHHRTYTTRRR